MIRVQWAGRLDFCDVNAGCCFPQVVKREGSGTESPMIGDKVTVHYTGWLLDGTKFDSSLDRKDKFSFDLGKGNILCLVLISFGNNRDGISLCGSFAFQNCLLNLFSLKLVFS